MTPREIALSICEPWFNGDPCEECKCHKVCTKLMERIETAIRAERVAEIGFGNMAQAVDCYGDGNVYRGQRSRDSETKTITFSKVETVEPVAYVTGYFDGKCVIRPIEHVVFPTGMALYRSPPTSQESRQVEPVAWLHEFEGVATLNMTPPNYYGDHWKHTALYTAPPKRNPMTEQQLDEMFDQAEISIYIADRQQKEHLEVYSFGVRDAEKWHGIGGEE